MNQNPDKQDVGASVPVGAIAASLVALAIILGGIYLYKVVSADESYPQIVIATGPKTGTYHALGVALKRVLDGTEAFSSVKILTTDGSVENMQLIGEEGSAVDLAFVQGDTAPSTYARLLTVLYDEVLHILISRTADDGIRTIYDLHGKRVALGTAGSGTRELSQRVLGHFGVVVGEDLVLSPTDAAAGLVDGSIDAAFILSAIPSGLVGELARQDSISFLSLGVAGEVGDEAHALELVFPGMRRDTIPRSTYVRWPREAIDTVSVPAMLVARQNLDEEMVRTITTTLFGHRTGDSGLEGSELLVARKIREKYDPAGVTIPYHNGATAYYRREEPPFFVEYAEALSLGLTAMLAIYSAFIALREWMRRRMKNRIDAYLLQVERMTSRMHALDHAELEQLQTALEDLRRQVFAALIDERVLADEAFTILQTHLRDELASIEARLKESVSPR